MNEALPLTEICKAVSSDFKKRRITHQKAAEMVGSTKQTITNQLSGKKRFSVNMADKFSSAFGYDTDFLLYGHGDLYREGRGVILSNGRNNNSIPNLYYIGYQDEPFKYSRQFRVAERIIEILNNKVAIKAFHAYMSDDFDEYEELISILENDYAYNLPKNGFTPEQTKALRYYRQWFTEMETKAAKELVLIEQKAASGEIIDVDEEVNRFRKRVLMYKNAFKDVAIKKHPELNIDEYMPQKDIEEFLSMSPDGITSEK